MKLIKELLTEGVMGLSVVGSDGASDTWYLAQKAMVKAAIPVLTKELKDKGNEYNTPGPLNVAMVLIEKFNQFDFSENPELLKLANTTLKLLQAGHGWEKQAGYKKIIAKLESLV